MKTKILLGVMVVLVVVGCRSKSELPKETAMMTESRAGLQAPTAGDVDPGKKYTAVIKTTKGEITCELFAKEAPLSVTNFKSLAEKRFYDGLTFHRVEPGFVVQGGDPEGTGSGGPGYTVPAEIGLPHKKGALAWARLGDEVNPKRDSSGSQFYITLAPTPFLDGAYTVFGQATSGMDVVEKIQRGDKIESIRVTASSY